MGEQLVSGNSTKAGLPDSLNEINQRIAEASKDSRFTAAQERKTAELEAKIEAQREQLRRAMEQVNLVSRARKTVDNLMKEYEKEQKDQFARSTEYCWVCVDMDAFYASVECLDAPELRSIPMAVGSSSMLSTANYEARKYGVSAAMPGYIAMKLCPELRIVPLRFDRYREMSGRVAEILSRYDCNLSMWSLDEAFLRLKKNENTEESSEMESFADIVQKMREEVKCKTGLTCSAGIACNPLLAKLASNHRKPDGQFEINRENVDEMREFLFTQPVRKLSGIGKVMSLTLERLFGISTVGELYDKRHFLPLIFKEKTVKSLLSKCIGHNDDDVEMGVNEGDGQKSVSCERTFQHQCVDVMEILREICDNLAEDVRQLRIVEIGRIGIKVKSTDFCVYTREKTAHTRTANISGVSGDIFRIAAELLTEFSDEEMRLLGVRLSNLKYSEEGQNRKRTLLEDWLSDNNAKCPICSKTFRNGNDLAGVNEHIDECLTKTALKEGL